jgi:hypothetical protein
MSTAHDSGPAPRPLFARLFVRSWEYRFPRVMWGLRFCGGPILVAVGLLLFAYDSWWGLLPLAGAAAAFFGGYRIYQITRSQPAA